MTIRTAAPAVLLAAALSMPAAHADITIGATLSLTGPGSSLGIPEQQTIELIPDTLAGHKVRKIILDDRSDPTQAVVNARKLTAEDKVDIIFGATLTPTSLAILDVIGPAETPTISLSGSGSIIIPQEGNKRFAFKLAPNEPIQGARIFEHATGNGIGTIAYISHATAFGESFTEEMQKVASLRKVRTVAWERFNPVDTSVTPQVLKAIGANPDAVLIAASGTSAAAPVIELRQRGFRKLIYLNQGIANNDFLRVGGKALEGAVFPVSPALVAEQLSSTNPIRKVAVEYVNLFEARHGKGSRTLFGATAWDAWLIMAAATPTALKAGQPGTPAFRRALRDTMERTKDFVGTQAVFNMSPTDHNGTDQRGQVLVKIENGTWKLLQE
jgi:branched-chain amino acid transport system substrate-binding protein